jgi:hypothetical protein
MSQNENSVTDEAKGRRSPISPILPIDEAIEKARQAYAKDKRAFTDFKTLAGHLGYKVEKKGGRSGRTVSTLKQYGLLDERDGKYRISDTAWKIFEMPEGSDERARLIKESALRPPMIRKVLDFYNGELPSDATLRSYLLFTEGFNADSAADFIRVLRRTIELVNPLPGDYNAGDESEGAAERPPLGATPMQQLPSSPPANQSQRGFTPPPTPMAGQHLSSLAEDESVLVFKISRDSEARVIFSGQVTQEAIDKLAALLNLSKDAYPTQAELGRRRKAEWHKNNLLEKYIWAIGKPYVRDGVEYMKVEVDGHPDEILEIPYAEVKFRE